MVNSPGTTYYNSTYRGGSQVENYTERCIPIFPSYEVNFPCTFYLVSETNKAYMETKGAPEEFGSCCILANEFHAPARNFSEKTNFTGTLDFGPDKYLGFEVYAPTSGGIFSYNWWTEEKIEEATGYKYYEPSFFYFTGIIPNLENPEESPLLPVWAY